MPDLAMGWGGDAQAEHADLRDAMQLSRVCIGMGSTCDLQPAGIQYRLHVAAIQLRSDYQLGAIDA